MHDAPNYTRVVFDTSEAVSYELFTLTEPDRVVVDFKNVTPHASFDTSGSTRGQTRVKALRTSARGSDYRVVLDLAAPAQPKGFTLEPVAPHGHRLVIDLHGASSNSTARPAPPPPPARETNRDVVIAIDAGHGGEDPGAIGPGRVYEKHVTLSIAKKLAAKLNQTPGYRAVLVRSGDYYIPLRQRVRIARDQRADLFVSVHADAFPKPHITGGSVYTLSERGASSENARWLAEKENRSDLIGGVGDVPLGDKDDMLAHVLLDLSMSANRSASIEAGQYVLAQLGSIGKLHKARVEQAGFAVLKSPDIPSILVETGFISNPEEARRLNTESHQNRIVDALLRGIRNYMETNAPPGTLLAGGRGAGDVRYTIARGDTLSGIASRHGTSASRIRAANGLRGDVIRVGQTIVIPAG
ncbi:MAG: N-acetylmuramoyl-L-alanine amidase [Pseudomonadales bacterium]|nr:N-acetylmuramoyl-L-alanine amidase [Pseudomonadales bacterium]